MIEAAILRSFPICKTAILLHVCKKHLKGGIVMKVHLLKAFLKAHSAIAKHIQPSHHSPNQDAQAKISRLSLPRTLPSSPALASQNIHSKIQKGAFV